MQTVMVRGRVFNYSHTIGRGATAGPGFRHPVDLALGDENTIYVLNRGDEFQACQRVSVVTMDEEFIRDFGGFGDGDGQFTWPAAIALDKEGNAYVADEWLNRISVFDKAGNFLNKWGTPGTGEGELSGPGGLVFDKDDNLYITEELNHRVQKFTRDGKLLLGWGKGGTGQGEFDHPWGIALDSGGDVYVADWHNDRVQKFTPEGQYLATFGTSGNDKGQVHLPSDVAVDKDGDVYITDWWNNKVEVYDADGVHLTTFLGDAEQLSKWAQAAVDANPDYVKARLRVKSLEPQWRFTRPTAIEIADDGKVLITDNQRARIQIYQKESDWVDPQFNL